MKRIWATVYTIGEDMKKVLIITSENDLTVDYIIDKYSSKVNFFRFNTDSFNKYSISVNDKTFSWEISNEYRKVSIDDIDAIYYRKPQLPNLSNYESIYHKLIYKELISFIEGIVETFEGKCLSKPSILKKADNKILQLKLAEKIGLNIPRSLITNSSSIAQEFCNKYLSIVKPLSIGKISDKSQTRIIQTNKVSLDKKFEDLDLCPAYFQQEIKKDYELRITVINDIFFSVKINSQLSKETKVDWRVDTSKLTYEITEIPDEIKHKCCKLLNLLNLKFGAFDFIVKDNEYVFLEVNPNGQWGWLEEELNLNISDAIIDYLVGD